MKISVVITVYNLRRFAAQAVSSALRQTLSPFEVVVVDDGSTDGSADILDSTFGDRIRLVRLAQNVGVMRATLEGLRRASGEIVCFLDGDDVWEAEKLERVARAFELDASVILVSHDLRVVDEEGNVIREDDPFLAPTRAVSARGDIQGLSRLMRASVFEYGGHVWLGSAYSIRRSALDLDRFAAWVDALPDPRLVYQDHPLATFLLIHDDGRVAYVDEKLLAYRLHDGNYSSAAIDLDRARSIVRKGLATRNATHALLAAAGPEFLEATAIQSAKLREYLFLDALYGRHLGAAIREFAVCARTTWTSAQTLKELSRLATVGVVGPERFLAFKRRYLDAVKTGVRRFGTRRRSVQP